MKIRFILIYTFLIFLLGGSSVHVFGQQITGDTRVCSDSEVTYTFTGTLTGNCTLVWSVEGGGFPDFEGNVYVSFSPADEDSKSIKVKWTPGATANRLTVKNCTNVSSSLDVFVIPPEISLTASQNQIGDAGISVELETNVEAATWSCNKSNCNLSATTGVSVTAIPSETTTYTVSGEVQYVFVDGTKNCMEKKSVTITVENPSVDLPSLDTWIPNCQTLPDFPDICGNIEMRCSFLDVTLKGKVGLGGTLGCYRFQWQRSSDNISWTNFGENDVQELVLHESDIPHNLVWFYRRVAIPSYSPLIQPGCVVYSTRYSNSVLVKRFDENNVLSGNYTSDIIVKGYNSVVSQGSANIGSSASVKVRSENLIRLDPGFSTDNGAEFIAEIGELCQGGTWRASLEDDQQVIAVEYIEPAFKVYPNPISEGILTFGKIANKYVLFDSMGTKVMEGEARDGFEITGLKSGVYILVTEDVSHKVLIK